MPSFQQTAVSSSCIAEIAAIAAISLDPTTIGWRPSQQHQSRLVRPQESDLADVGASGRMFGIWVLRPGW